MDRSTLETNQAYFRRPPRDPGLPVGPPPHLWTIPSETGEERRVPEGELGLGSDSY